MRINLSKLFTREVVVGEEGVDKADLKIPVTVVKDGYGNYELVDGNHRVVKAIISGRKTIKATKLGDDPRKNVAEDEWKRPVRELKIRSGRVEGE